MPYRIGEGMDVMTLVRQMLADTKQDQLAVELGVTQATVSRWLTGSDPKGANRDKIVGLAQRRGLITSDDRPRNRGMAASKFLAVPLVSWVSAGKLIDASTQVPESEFPRLPFADLGSGDFVALKVRGDSMDRYSPDGSVIVVNRRDRVLQEGRPYVFVIRGEATYKLWRARPPRLEPYSTNPMNEPIYVAKRSEVDTLGRVKRTVLDF